jgi:hypothetical protein
MNQPDPQTVDEPPPALSDAEQARIEFLFRAERRRGVIHPLQHIVQRYRAEARPRAGDEP